ncbi:MAG TPA: hypothetical protein VGV08_07635 [Casimicrobiaceae bacterium]|nr:hypothetical protein [Casimicrobiaceae bacterium]
MTKCRMCSQVLYGRRKLCQDCEWELESAQVAASGGDSDPPSVGTADALPQSVPPADASQPDASTSFKLWRTKRDRRTTTLALVAAVALAIVAGLHPGRSPARYTSSVMEGADAAASASRAAASGGTAPLQRRTAVAANR